MSARLLAVACVAIAFRPLANDSAIGGRWWDELPVMLALVIVAWLFEAVVSALIRTEALRTKFVVALGDEFRVQIPIGAATGASALLIAFAAEVMGLAAVAVFAVAAARHPGRAAPVRRDQGHLPADGPRAGPLDRGRRLRRGGALGPGEQAGGGGRAGARHAARRRCSSSSTPP